MLKAPSVESTRCLSLGRNTLGGGGSPARGGNDPQLGKEEVHLGLKGTDNSS